MKIVADNKIPFLNGALEPYAEVLYLPGKEIQNRHLRDADALIVRTRTKCNKELLEGTSVRFIATATIGYDHIDTDYCRKEGIAWTNAEGCNSSSVEQYIVSVLLALGERHGFDLTSKTLGIIGVGNVGSKVSAAANALGMKVLLNDPPRQAGEGPGVFTAFDEVLGNSDILSFHVPLTLDGEYKTWHMAGPDFFSRLKEKAILINSSRGEVVNEEALMNSLEKGKLADAVLDVWENEPKISQTVLDKLGIGTPHIAGYSADGKANGTMMSVQSLSRFFGLKMDSWKPMGIPVPGDLQIVVDAFGKSKWEIIREVYFKTYSVENDDNALRDNPNKFEKLRADYPLRREPSNYTVRLNNNAWEEIPSILEKLGFGILNIDCFC